jgi:hypothetical protein
VIDDLQRQFVAHLVERRKDRPATAAALPTGAYTPTRRSGIT